MKKILLLAGILGMFCVNRVEAQQIAQFSQYMFNGLYINPAYAGQKDMLYGHMVFRRQWVGIGGAPQTTMLSLDGNLSKGSNIGFIYTNDKIGATYTNSFMVDYAYRFQIGENKRLSFGLSAGMVHHGFNRYKLLNEDGSLIDVEALSSKNVWKPGFDAGLYFDMKNFYAGFSIIGIVANKADTKSFQVIRTDANYFLTLGGTIPLNEKLKLLPSTLLKTDLKNPLTFDINAMLMISDRFSVGGSYRTGVLWFTDVEDNTRQRDALSLISEIHITDNIRIGMAYDFDLNKVTTGTNGSFEISLGYYFTKIKKNTRPSDIVE
ncbi:MAG: type IX secretion system membrane protein PorP/SprF [Prevotellaceae bacterium]|jgi:type IX secretion system PorP/SprF family membrane protein|nr:type IX secretion system membrane protein PorP/SprF [Prevotellaceae bacterium]